MQPDESIRVLTGQQWMEMYFLGDSLMLADALIAATAIEYKLTLCSANAKHFRPIQGLALQTFEP